jgi:hypothetical protein
MLQLTLVSSVCQEGTNNVTHIAEQDSLQTQAR